MGGFEPPLVLFKVPNRNLKEHSDNPYTTSDFDANVQPNLHFILRFPSTRTLHLYCGHCNLISSGIMHTYMDFMSNFSILVQLSHIRLVTFPHKYPPSTVPLSRWMLLSTMVMLVHWRFANLPHSILTSMKLLKNLSTSCKCFNDPINATCWSGRTRTIHPSAETP